MQPPASAYVQLDDSSRVPLQFVSAATKTDPRIQGLSFFFTAPVASPLLPGMSVVALLATGRTVIGAVVPPSAILWEQGRAWAFFRTGPDRFARRTVATDLPTPDGGYLVQGLPDNSAVVVAGRANVVCEEFRAQSPIEDCGERMRPSRACQAYIIRLSLQFPGIVVALFCLLVVYGVYNLDNASYGPRFPEFAPPPGRRSD